MYSDKLGVFGYDLIGDVHGCAKSLKKLLALMGYKVKAGVYRHPQRQAVFVGDIVDRGPNIRESLHLVRNMVETGSAQLIMGNHEFNVLAYCTQSNSGDGYLRAHTARHNRLIAETLEQFASYPDDLKDFLTWFKQLPLLLEFKNFRAVHACWDQNLIDLFLEKYPNAKMDKNFLYQAADVNTFAGSVVDRLTRGVDIKLPKGQSICSKDGYLRRFFRAAFWVEKPQTYADIVFQPDPLPECLKAQKLTEKEKSKLCYYSKNLPPLFFGHYWRSKTPRLIAPNIACLDYSAVKYGKLVAYRMDQEKVLSDKKFVWVNVMQV